MKKHTYTLYIYDISKYQNLSTIEYENIVPKCENTTKEQLIEILGTELDYHSIALSRIFTSHAIHLIISNHNSWDIFYMSRFIGLIEHPNQYLRNFVICKNILVDINYCSPVIESYCFIDCRICSLNVTQDTRKAVYLNFYKCSFMCDFDAEIKTSSIYMEEIKNFIYSMFINIDYPTFSYFLSPDELGKSDDDTSYQESYKLTISGDGITELNIRNVEYDDRNFFVKNDSDLSMNLSNTRKITLDSDDAISWLNIIDSEQLVLNLTNKIGRIIVKDTSIEKLKFKNCNFISKVPVFDNSSTIKHSVDIDKKSFDNLLNIKNAGLLEYSRLAEFFNRNNAYIEAQQLHRHYLLAKAKESLNKGSKEDNSSKENKPCFSKKWFGLYGIVKLYDWINGCGTSLWKPFIAMFFVWIANAVILQYQFSDGAKVLYYSINNILPLAGIFNNADDIKLPFVILALKLTSIIATLLWFLIALQIRKLLRLKE